MPCLPMWGIAARRPKGPGLFATSPGQPLPVRVLLNRFDPASDLHQRNLAWLREEDGFEVLHTADGGWERTVLG